MDEISSNAARQRSEAWAKTELAAMKPADPRCLRRLHQVVAAQHRQPGASIPQANDQWAEAKAAYRLGESEAFSVLD